MISDQEPDPDLASELRRTAGREWLREAAEDERLTELYRRRRLSVAGLAEDMAHRGVRATLAASGAGFTGNVVWAGEDFATLRAQGQDVDVRLEFARWELLDQGQTAAPDPTGAEGFIIHLNQLASSRSRVGLLLGDGEIVVGVFEVIAADHVEFHSPDGRVLIVPMGSVVATIRSTDSH